jgi:hypothetical protein
MWWDGTRSRQAGRRGMWDVLLEQSLGRGHLCVVYTYTVLRRRALNHDSRCPKY